MFLERNDLGIYKTRGSFPPPSLNGPLLIKMWASFWEPGRLVSDSEVQIQACSSSVHKKGHSPGYSYAHSCLRSIGLEQLFSTLVTEESSREHIKLHKIADAWVPPPKRFQVNGPGVWPKHWDS